MFVVIRIYAVEILSIVMGIWLLWITIIYTNYFKALKSHTEPESPELNKDSTIQKARDKRKRTYNMAVTYPSYTIFWVAVIVWGASFIINYTPS
jgi:hypothetical protein